MLRARVLIVVRFDRHGSSIRMLRNGRRRHGRLGCSDAWRQTWTAFSGAVVGSWSSVQCHSRLGISLPKTIAYSLGSDRCRIKYLTQASVYT